MFKMSAAAAILAGLVAMPAMAAQQQRTASPPTAAVGYSDLNLNSAEGRAALAGRVRRAALRICGSGNLEPVGMQMARRACNRAALRSAEAQVSQAIAGFGTTRLASRGTQTLPR